MPKSKFARVACQIGVSGVISRMKLSDKVKVALEETRILILGAQILLGFGFRGVFSERFDELPGYARYAVGVGLGLLVCAVGLLIAPGPYHRIVEKGQDSGRLHRVVTVIADLAWRLLSGMACHNCARDLSGRGNA